MAMLDPVESDVAIATRQNPTPPVRALTSVNWHVAMVER